MLCLSNEFHFYREWKLKPWSSTTKVVESDLWSESILCLISTSLIKITFSQILLSFFSYKNDLVQNLKNDSRWSLVSIFERKKLHPVPRVGISINSIKCQNFQNCNCDEPFSLPSASSCQKVGFETTSRNIYILNHKHISSWKMVYKLSLSLKILYNIYTTCYECRLNGLSMMQVKRTCGSIKLLNTFSATSIWQPA